MNKKYIAAGVVKLIHVSKENIKHNAIERQNNPDCELRPCYIIKVMNGSTVVEEIKCQDWECEGYLRGVYNPDSDLGTVAFIRTTATILYW